MKKRGQFYLIAAIIIVTVIIGLASVTNYVITKKTPVKFYDLSSEINSESGEVVDYGLVKEKDLPILVGDFIENYVIPYSKGKETGIEPVFVYGNEDNLTILTYTTQETGTMSITGGGMIFTVTGDPDYLINIENFDPMFEEGEGFITVSFSKNIYDFNLEDGENFFFIITKKIEEEIYVTGTI